MTVVNNLTTPARAPSVFVKFQRPEIQAELGRYVFALLNAFATSGYRILLSDSVPLARLGMYAIAARSFPAVTLTNALPDETSGTIYLFDVEDKEASRRHWLRKIRVAFDVFAPYWFRRPILMPFSIHPVHVTADLRDRLASLRAGRRRMRIFFSGDMEGYTRNHISYPGPKLPRLEVVNSVRQHLGERVLFIQDQGALDDVLNGGYVDKCVILDTTRLRIPDQQWLDVLAKADFFLAPPGIVMPMCHNSIEALAVGSIPVINYGEWFDPPLRSMMNCVAFDSRQSLVTAMETVFSMHASRMADMRANAVAYYDSVLSAEAFVRRIENSTESKLDVLVITERYVAQNSNRLGRHSVLFRRSTDPGPLARIRSLIR